MCRIKLLKLLVLHLTAVSHAAATNTADTRLGIRSRCLRYAEQLLLAPGGRGSLANGADEELWYDLDCKSDNLSKHVSASFTSAVRQSDAHSGGRGGGDARLPPVGPRARGVGDVGFKYCREEEKEIDREQHEYRIPPCSHNV
ncbi:hypothetical protein EYF80_049045 [Liparis tanakae]|uniref:Uncharacterized protein n=1 Tax=Liparis tanakae TaxID=230148 RepID=A0A4Z2FHS9_9TELE|nr:hypothetical protein EYF80_049045 [Liparis tanakae]